MFIKSCTLLDFYHCKAFDGGCLAAPPNASLLCPKRVNKRVGKKVFVLDFEWKFRHSCIATLPLNIPNLVTAMDPNCFPRMDRVV